MHVTVDITNDATEGFNRRMRVEIPEDRIMNDVNEQIRSLMPTTKIPGFRPGKAPLKLLLARYGREAREDVVRKLLYSTFQEALTQENLRLADSPTFDEINSDSGKGLTYTATFDVYPEIETPDVKDLEIRRPVAEVTDEDVDRMIETLRKQCKTWSKIERPAANGDRVMVDFEGVVSAKPAEETVPTETASSDTDSSPETTSSPEAATPEIKKGTNVPVELGSGTMIEGFEKGLIGVEAGDERALELEFPDQYYNPELAGRPVTFTVKVQSVEESSLPDTDEDLIGYFGIEDENMETFRAATREDMEQKLASAVQAETNKRVIEALLASNPISGLPKNVVTKEAKAIAEKKRHEFMGIGVDMEKLDLQPSKFESEAHQQITLSLLLNKLVSVGNITVESDSVRKRIETIASGYQDPKKVIAWYYDDDERLLPIRMMVLQDKVVEWVLEHANVTEDRTSFDALLNPSLPSTLDAQSDAKDT
uniref:Trigger factor n=1 Tax=Candidatus Kentrum sp. FW TaxID=2126338 RepID=A0A450TUI1_9GAMM|nr:MAG: trigger factor [Candidatus Kentron sp. FW]